MIGHLVRIRSLVILGLLAGCNPFQQPGTWHATGVNQANLDTEVVDKRDTVVGQQAAGSDAVLDTAAVVRLHADQAKKFRIESTGGGS